MSAYEYVYVFVGDAHSEYPPKTKKSVRRALSEGIYIYIHTHTHIHTHAYITRVPDSISSHLQANRCAANQTSY